MIDYGKIRKEMEHLDGKRMKMRISLPDRGKEIM